MTLRSAQEGQGRAPLLSLVNVTKSFDATQALRGVSLTIKAGEFVGLVGPNGAGKSTLIKILDGVYGPDGGTITAGRVGVVHQDLGLIDSLTVTENLRLGQPALCSVPPLLSAVRERDFCREALRAVGLRADLAHRSVERLSLGERTLVAIARTLARGAELIVVDEATSTLPPRESGWLIDTLKARRLAGAAVLMVSHKLAEILGCADRCVVLVDGKLIADEPIERVDLATLTRLMSRSSQQQAGPERACRVPAGSPLLSLAGASTALAGPFTLDVHAGEIVGVTGLVGSGLYELALLASGRTRPASGSVRTAAGVRVGLLPPDRSAQGSFPAESVAWNLTIGGLRRWRTRAGTLDHPAELGAARALAVELDVRPPNVSARMAALSGGNQQKVLLGRMLLAQSDAQAGCVVLCEPTRGVDIGARADIYRLIRQLADQGIGVLVVSSDTEDLLTLADRVGVVENQSCQRTWRPDELSTEQMASLL